MKTIPLDERIIFALDFADPNEAMVWVDKLDEQISFFKVGLELFIAGGWQVVDHITERGNKVMLDLKLHDIPETVSRAVKQVSGRGVTFTTVHGYDPVMEAASRVHSDVKILAITVLTSMGTEDLQKMGFQTTARDLVKLRAGNAVKTGCDGVVCSAQEAEIVRQKMGNDALIVTPGIRLGAAGENNDDQKRIATPGRAITAGADYLVIGRPIRDANDPAGVIKAIHQEIAAAISLSPSRG